MFEQILLVVIQTFLAGLLYGLLRWRVMRSTHAFRIEVAREAKYWVSDPRITERARKSLTTMLEMMYRSTAPWLVVIALVWAAFCPSKSVAKSILSEDGEIAEKVLWVKLRLIFALITTSPAACAVGAIFMILDLALRRSLRALYEVISAAGDPVFMISPANLARRGR